MFRECHHKTSNRLPDYRAHNIQLNYMLTVSLHKALVVYHPFDNQALDLAIHFAAFNKPTNNNKKKLEKKPSVFIVAVLRRCILSIVSCVYTIVLPVHDNK